MRRAHPTFATFAVLTTLGFGAAATGVVADEYHGTFEQQMACTQDVFRFCGGAIPDTDRIVVCLRQNTSQLSRGCRAVFGANDSMMSSTGPAPQNGGPGSRSWH
jgi:hypothetical protein